MADVAERLLAEAAVVVLRSSRTDITRTWVDEVREVVEARLPGVKLLVVPGDGMVVVYRPDDNRPDGTTDCVCPLLDVTAYDGEPEFVRGDPAGCPVHATGRDAVIANAKRRARER